MRGDFLACPVNMLFFRTALFTLMILFIPITVTITVTVAVAVAVANTSQVNAIKHDTHIIEFLLLVKTLKIG